MIGAHHTAGMPLGYALLVTQWWCLKRKTLNDDVPEGIYVIPTAMA